MASCTSTKSNLLFELKEIENVSKNLQNNPVDGEYNLVREFEIEMSNFVFSKKIINVGLGDKVRINLINTNGFHNFVIDELNINSKIITGGEIEHIEFITTKKGEYEFYSSYKDDKMKGMTGKLFIK
jgi:plastocyanin